MNRELTQRLVKRFPVLYQDYHSPMTQTCMCWGFDHGDGWFEIIWQLSLAIEEELGYSWPQKRWFLVKKGFFRWWNRAVYKLSPAQDDKRKQEGSGTKEDPYRWVVVEKAPRDCLARLAWKLFPPPRFDDYRSWPAKLQRLGFKAFESSSGFRDLSPPTILSPLHAALTNCSGTHRTASGSGRNHSLCRVSRNLRRSPKRAVPRAVRIFRSPPCRRNRTAAFRIFP